MLRNRDSVCDYIIHRVRRANAGLSLLKLQKLLYYVQAWHLAFYGRPLFEGRFQAWVHGPVNREIYDRFASTKSLYSEVGHEDLLDGFSPEALDPGARNHIDSVLEVYAGHTGTQLEDMTHSEAPWIEARQGYRPADRCEEYISEETMANYYRARLPADDEESATT